MTQGVSIIAVVGASSSGKSTIAHHLVTHHGYTRIRFAQPLKDMLITLGLTHAQVDGPQAIRTLPSELLCGKSPRHAMQTLGTEWRDTIDKRLWSRITEYRIDDMIERGITKFVIDDMRFPHEVPGITARGGTLVGCRRPEVEPTKLELFVASVPMPSLLRRAGHLLFGIRPLHKSETEWLKIKRHVDIDNTGTLNELWANVDQIVKNEECS